MVRVKSVQTKNLNIQQCNTDIVSQLDLLPVMITQATTVNRPIDDDIDGIRSNQSKVTAVIFAQKSQQNLRAGFQPQTQKDKCSQSKYEQY